MRKRVFVLDGHPDKDRSRFCHALAEAYAEAAREAGHEIRLLTLADADIHPVHSAAEFASAPTEPAVLSARDDLLWANHIVLVFPLWIGSAPALVRALLEQSARGEFFAGAGPNGPQQKLKGRSARMIVTMGMPALAYRLIYGAHGLKSLALSALGFAGMAPVRMTLFGGIEQQGRSGGEKRLRIVRALGEDAI